jgi:hypothetical protein
MTSEARTVLSVLAEIRTVAHELGQATDGEQARELAGRLHQLVHEMPLRVVTEPPAAPSDQPAANIAWDAWQDAERLRGKLNTLHLACEADSREQVRTESASRVLRLTEALLHQIQWELRHPGELYE